MSTTTLTEEQLRAVKAMFVQAVVNTLDVRSVVQLAGVELSNQYASMDAADFKDFVISNNSLDVWDQLTAQAIALDENAAAEEVVVTKDDAAAMAAG